NISDVAKIISGKLTVPSEKPPKQLATEFLSRFRILLGVHDPSAELERYHTDATPNGHFIRFKQKRNGLEVVGADITIRVHKGIITSIVNNFEPLILLATSPSISREEAIVLAKTSVNLPAHIPGAVLLVFPWEDSFYLAYRIDFQFTPDPDPSKFRVYIDAHTGKVILIENRVMNDVPAVGTGLGVDGALKTLDTYEKGEVYYLGDVPFSQFPDITIKTYSAGNSKSLSGSLLSDTDNYWTDPAPVDAHFFGNVVFDFYKNNFSNFSWFANSGFKASGGLVSTVHYKVAYDNAFWDGRQMVYGDGDTLFYPLSGALDVVAHEITHGITEAISNFTYCKEPGALSESWSDVMGMFNAIDYGYANPYWIASTIMKIAAKDPAYYALRRMDDPPFRTDQYSHNDYYPESPLKSWGQPENTAEQYMASCWPWTDNGGVHINSGIPNKAAYLITVNPSVGPAKAKQIYYYALFYLTPSSQFVDARDAVEQAATDLYGIGAELSAVQAAFEAVGIH
ncbi:MAG: M4 family metallopeptidase, partial [Thermodesulfovibrionales bacterium]